MKKHHFNKYIIIHINQYDLLKNSDFIYKNHYKIQMNKIKKLYQLRESLFSWEKEIGIDNLSEKSKIIFSYLLTIKKFPVAVNSIKYNELIEKNMSIATFNRAIKELVQNQKISLLPDPRDKRSQIVNFISSNE